MSDDLTFFCIRAPVFSALLQFTVLLSFANPEYKHINSSPTLNELWLHYPVKYVLETSLYCYDFVSSAEVTSLST